MRLILREQNVDFIDRYGSISIAFEVGEIFDVEAVENHSADFRLTRRRVQAPFIKDYDAIPGATPRDWATHWDLRTWCMVAAFVESEHIGGAAIALEAGQALGDPSHADGAVVWDLRVHPDYRGNGIGKRLIAFAEDRARRAGKAWLSVETQNINVPACRLYAAAGFTLRSIDPHAYPDLPGEVQMIWTKRLTERPVD